MSANKPTPTKCRIYSCTRLVGPIRQKVSKLCWPCDRNLENLASIGMGRRLERRRRCAMGIERQESLPHAASHQDVVEYVRTLVKRRLKEAKKK